MARADRDTFIIRNRAANPEAHRVCVQKKCRVASERNEAKRTCFREQVETRCADDLVFLDETGVSLALFCPYGWGKKGKPLVEAVPTNRGKNLSVLGAFDKEGMICTSTKLGAMKRVDVERFLQDDLLPRLLPGSVLIFDNATIHKGGRVKRLINEAGCHLLYLPPYSPDMNPIELVWGWVKERLRRLGPRDEQARQQAVDAALTTLATLPETFAAACFRHCNYLQQQ